MSNRAQILEVWLDCDIAPACQVGTLAHDRGQVRFHYDRNWLKSPHAFALDTDLSLGRAALSPRGYRRISGQRVDGGAPRAGTDLEQLFRRVAFNVAIGNRDDHLRNHGFVLGTNGWRLAPAFDVNPNIDKAAHVLNIDDADSSPSLDTVLATSQFYGLSPDRAHQVVKDVASVVDDWRVVAREAGIAAADIELTAAAFSAHSEYAVQ
jgi:hypothetical protein